MSRGPEFNDPDFHSSPDPEAELPLDEIESAEDALRIFDSTKVQANLEVVPTAREVALIENLAENATNLLEAYGVADADYLSGETYNELCRILRVDPESVAAYAAIEDLVFMLEEENFKARNMVSAPSLEDVIYMAGQDFSESQRELTSNAYMYLRPFLKDPILLAHQLKIERDLIIDDIVKIGTKQETDFERYEADKKRVAELREDVIKIDEKIDEISPIDEITVRRERGLKRMHWLLRQEFMRDKANELLAEYRRLKTKPDFELLAAAVAGQWSEELRVEDTADGAKVRRIQGYAPGIVDNLLKEHLSNMSDGKPRSKVERANDIALLRRLTQAQAICRNVFHKDLADRVYLVGTISPNQYRELARVKERLFAGGDIGVMDELISLLPGSPQWQQPDSDLDNLPLPRKFSGRSKNEVGEEINAIITQDSRLRKLNIPAYVIARYRNKLSTEDSRRLAVNAFYILEKMIYQHNHKVEGLVAIAE